MTRIDLHVKLLNESVVERARSRGLEAIVYAPHFTQLPTIEARAATYSTQSLTVIPAREIFTGPWWNRRHILAIGLTDPIPDFIPLEQTMNEIERQGAAVLIPHPTFLSVSLTSEEIDHYADRIHALEIYNPKHLKRHNRRAKHIAQACDLPTFGSSYAHRTATIGEVWTTLTTDITDVFDLRDALIAGKLGTIERNTGWRHSIRCGAEVAHLGWENTWQKFNRVILEEKEPTHPNNPCYADRFSD